MRRARLAFLVLGAMLAVAGPGCRARRRPGPAVTLPALALSPAQAALVARIQLQRPGDADPSRMSVIILERQGDGWRVTTPLRARASADKVSALLANLQDLRLTARLDAGTGFYERFDLTEGRALHVVAQTAAKQTLVEFLAGKSSEQGQLIRLPGVPGIFALANDGPRSYQGFLYTRDVRSWRDPALLAFTESEVAEVDIANRHGSFRFRRDAASAPGGWAATFARRRTDGTIEGRRPAWPRFDGRRVDEMLRAYQALAADGFGVPADLTDSGLADAEHTGGVVRIRLRRAGLPLTLRVGAPAPERSGFAITGGRWAATDAPGDGAGLDAPCVLSPWTARWATGDKRTFERAR